jgi:HEAT repeat protein
LVIAALRASGEDDRWSDERWEAVEALRELASDEVFERAVVLTRSASPIERTLGSDVLGQIGVASEDRREELARRSVPVLVELAEREREPRVLRSIGYGFGHRSDRAGLPALLRFARHPDPDVRHSAAWALPAMAAGGAPAAAVVPALIGLMRDSDAEVREWATFGLGSLLKSEDSPEIRDALATAAEDPDFDVRGEAARGLTRRGDERALDLVMRELAGDPPRAVVDAARELSDAALLPALKALRDRGWGEGDYEQTMLGEAIERSGGGPRTDAGTQTER